MAKENEIAYFKALGSKGVEFTLQKPFSTRSNTGSLLHDIAAVFTLLPPPPAKILDMGCGSGWTSSFFAQAGYEVVGIDIAPEAIRAARKHFKHIPGLKFINSDYDQPDLKNDFDVVIFFDSLHHSDDEVLALKSAISALRPGGQLIACEPGLGHSKSAASQKAMREYGVNERDMPPRLLKKSLRKSGFIRTHTYAYPAISHRALYVTRKGNFSKLRNNAFMRGLTAFALATVLRHWHGIVTAQKPR